MGSMNALLDISRSALNNAQTAINITASNIANQSVAGYSRRIATFNSGDTVQIAGMPTSTGATVSVHAQRDRVLDQRVQNATQAQSAADTRSSAMQNIDSIFTLDANGNDGAGIGAATDALFAAFRTLQADPSGTSARQSVTNAALSFATALNTAANRLASISSSLQTQASDALADVNSTAAQIADLNSRIAEAGTTDATSLLDQRQAALVHLSSLVGFNQIAGDNGAINVALGDGTPLVTGGAAHSLNASIGASGLRIVTDANIDVTDGIRGGSIGGTLQAYKLDLPTAIAGLDQLASNIATAVNAANAAGKTTSGATGSPIFTLPSTTAGSAAAIGIASTDSSIIAAASKTEGATGGSNAGAIASLGSTAIVNGQTPSAYFAAFLTRLGGDISAAQQDSTTANDALTQSSTQRDALSGVSLDEEAANLTQFQRSYQAAAKIFAIVNDLLASSINLGSETTVA